MDSPPATLEEFRAVACGAAELTGPNGEDLLGFPLRIDGFDMFSFIVANGGFVFDDASQTYDFTNEGAVEVLQFFQDLFNDGCIYIPESSFANTADFALGLNPMAVGSTAGIPFINGDIETNATGIEWVNTTVPWTEGNRTIQVFLRSMSMLVSTPEEQLATWLFIKHMASPASQNTWTQMAQYIPYTAAGLAAIDDGTVTVAAQLSQITSLMEDENVHLWAVPDKLGSQSVFFGVADTLVADITTGGMDVMEAATKATEAANEILEEAAEDM
jgi:ABC-type glycerol-3-phosphate transport system substrate-binding protein